jgi:hypothetical protein
MQSVLKMLGRGLRREGTRDTLHQTFTGAKYNVRLEALEK